MSQEEPIAVYKAWNSRQAHFVCRLLIDQGIEARVASDAGELAAGRVPYQVAACPVWVHKADYDQAREIVEAYDKWLHERWTQTPRESEPFCYHCGQSVEGSQTPCPNCGHELDWSDGQ